MKPRHLTQIATTRAPPRATTRPRSLSQSSSRPLINSRAVHRIAPQAASIPSAPRAPEHHPLDASPAALPPSTARRIPSGAWDSHMHIIEPSTFSLSSKAVYRPARHYSVDDALSFESSLGIRNLVLVQPSIYGHDNSCLLDALRRLGGSHSARGVVSFDPAVTSLATLRRWHALGVRGVRVNIQSHGLGVDPEQLTRDLQQYADAIRPLETWVLQLYVPMSLMQGLEQIVPRLGVRVCIDHLGHPDLSSKRPSQDLRRLIPGFQSLLALLEGGQTFVKLSAPYRLVSSYDGDDYLLETIAKELLRARGSSRVVFGTDWPHTRFEGLDIRPWIDKVFDWCGGDEVLVDRLFRRNAEDLWDVHSANP